jgi:hypothetical protein
MNATVRRGPGEVLAEAGIKWLYFLLCDGIDRIPGVVSPLAMTQ